MREQYRETKVESGDALPFCPFPRETAIEKLKILVVDDSSTNVLMMKMLLGNMGHEVVTASDGLLGIETFRQEDPEVILMDVMMPNMDGIESARRIREISAVVPIIFLSAATDSGLMEQALRLGSDYITKPIQMPQLLDKLNAHFRTILAYREVLAQKKEVEQLHARLVDENTIASHVLTRMLSGFQPPSEILQYTVIPSGMFSGDIVLVGATPSGKLNILLADAIGHGLPAAFSLMPIVPAFHAMTKKGFPLEDILYEINHTLKNVLPIGQFVAATAAALDWDTGLCKTWVGANPGLMLLSGSRLSSLPSTHLALGITDDRNKEEFVCETVQLKPGDRLIFASDGLVEAWDDNVKRQEGTLEEFILACSPAEIFDKVLTVWKRYHQHDDASLAVLHMTDRPTGGKSPGDTVTRPVEHARITLDLNAGQLAKPEIFNMVLDAAQQMGIVDKTDSQFGVVFSELFNNALDHGILGLSSETKYAAADGFDDYIRLKQARLASLTEGRMSVQIEATEFSGKPATLLRIVDSGPGFDQTLLRAATESVVKATAGRGCNLVQSISLQVTYAGSGNDVTAYIPRPE